jgi:uncharacterized membrane protein
MIKLCQPSRFLFSICKIVHVSGPPSMLLADSYLVLLKAVKHHLSFVFYKFYRIHWSQMFAAYLKFGMTKMNLRFSLTFSSEYLPNAPQCCFKALQLMFELYFYHKYLKLW